MLLASTCGPITSQTRPYARIEETLTSMGFEREVIAAALAQPITNVNDAVAWCLAQA